MINDQLNLDFLKTLCVLYVEDDTETRDQFVTFLRRKVGKLLVAADGAEGLQACQKQQPDIIITDIQMPVMDGLTMCRKIHHENPSLPIIILTAFEQVDYLTRAACTGIEKYVTKPVDSDRLVRCLIECATIVKSSHWPLISFPTT